MAYIEWRYSARLGRDRAILRVMDHDGRVRARATKIPRSNEPMAVQLLNEMAARLSKHNARPPRAMLKAWLKTMDEVRAEGTKDYYRSKVRQLLKAMPEDWTGWDQEALDKATIAYRRSHSPRSGSMFTQAAEAFLVWAASQGVSHLPPRLTRMACKRSERPLPTLHTPQEIGRLLEAARGLKWPVPALAYYLGLRRSEIRTLTWEDFGPEGVRVRAGKTALERRVPIHPDLMQHLPEPGTGKVVSGSWNSAPFYKRLARVYRLAGVEYPKDRPLHILRHSLASHLLAKGAPLVAVRDILGHTDVRTTNRYAHSSSELRAKAMGML